MLKKIFQLASVFIIGIVILTTFSFLIVKVIVLPLTKVPVLPLTDEQLIESSDLIVYVEVLELDKNTAQRSKDSLLYPKQIAQVNVLKVLKGSVKREDIKITKKRAYFQLQEKQRLVLYLKKYFGSYQTVSVFSQETRIASAIANVNEYLIQDGSGIVVGITNKEPIERLNIHILKGRNRAPILLGGKNYQKNIVITRKTEEFDIAEIPLDPGSYTILIEYKDALYSFNRLVDGYYPYVIIGDQNYSNWRSVNFDFNQKYNK